MYEIRIETVALRQLRKFQKHVQVEILDTIERHLTYEPWKESKSRIKRLRGKQNATYRLRIGDYRAYYDITGSEVIVLQVLHKSETREFYQGGGA